MTNLPKPSQHSASSHPPLMSSDSLKSVSRESASIPDSFHIRTPFARGKFTEVWPVSGEQGFNSFLMGQVHLVQDPAPASSLGTGPALTPCAVFHSCIHSNSIDIGPLLLVLGILVDTEDTVENGDSNI